MNRFIPMNFLHKINFLQRKDAPRLVLQLISFSKSVKRYIVNGEQSLDQVNSLLSGICLVMRVYELRVIGRSLCLDISVFKGNQNIKANVVLLVAFTLR
jgi:hypothetical protein